MAEESEKPVHAEESLMEKIAEKIYDSSSSSDSDHEKPESPSALKAKIYRLFGREKPVHKVPVAAAVYYEDMYVNFKLVMETASQISGIRLWVTNEYMHSGLRDAGRQILDHLLGMINGKKPLF
ncbi:hypothetical protein F2Q70_00044224 [Brassica cretica]|uniref:Uncharacterized protein n=1 Tax=Brassica cretica TaxID=69181 RepID=A0A8S9KKX9_BRACR|nr:hypothetical protein F2Q70_00044224 [Brassica cretica]